MGEDSFLDTTANLVGILIILVVAHERTVDEHGIAPHLTHSVWRVVSLCDIVGEDAVSDGQFPR